MKLDKLSRLGILEGTLLILFFSGLIVCTAIKIDQINFFTEALKDFNEYPLPTLDIPIGIIVVSLIAIVLSGLMIYGIIERNMILIGLWLVPISVGVIIEVIFLLHKLSEHFSFEELFFVYCVVAIPILLISPIAMIFHNIFEAKRNKL